MNLRLSANSIVTNRNGEILFVELKKGPFAGGICIPGGGVELGELAMNAVIREIKDETGILIENTEPIGFCELIHEGFKDHRIVTLWHSDAEGEPISSDEGKAFWSKYEDVGDKLIPFARGSIEMWLSGKKHFKLVGDETGITWKWKD